MPIEIIRRLQLKFSLKQIRFSLLLLHHRFTVAIVVVLLLQLLTDSFSIIP